MTSVNPVSAPRDGIPRTVTVTGSGFVSGATVGFSRRMKVLAVRLVDATRLDVDLKALATAAIGPRTVTVTNPSGATASCACFTVTAP